MKLWIIFTVVFGLLIGLAACSRGGEKKLKLAFITNNASDFWTIARKGVEQAGRELPNVETEFKIPGEGSAAEQKRIVDDLLAKGIDGMSDPTNVRAVDDISIMSSIQ